MQEISDNNEQFVFPMDDIPDVHKEETEISRMTNFDITKTNSLNHKDLAAWLRSEGLSVSASHVLEGLLNFMNNLYQNLCVCAMVQYVYIKYDSKSCRGQEEATVTM